MKIKLDKAGLGQSSWYECVIRLVFGGAVTALTGIVAKRFGAEIGGLFLAFPAIFPAAATLIEKHEKQKKERVGEDGRKRGRWLRALMQPERRSEASGLSHSPLRFGKGSRIPRPALC